MSNEILKQLIVAVKTNFNPHTNQVELAGAEAAVGELLRITEQEVGNKVSYYKSHLFIASPTTPPEWHTDLSSSEVNGDCYNIWVPLFVKASPAGIRVIPKEKNADLYEKLGDSRLQVDIFERAAAPKLFDLARVSSQYDILFLKKELGMLLPYQTQALHIESYQEAKVGDLAIFKQDEVHSGIGDNGIRLQLQLKFITAGTRLNAEPSNRLYQLFKTYTGSTDDLQQFKSFSSQVSGIMENKQLSKHGRLQAQLVPTLLECQLDQMT